MPTGSDVRPEHEDDLKKTKSSGLWDPELSAAAPEAAGTEAPAVLDIMLEPFSTRTQTVCIWKFTFKNQHFIQTGVRGLMASKHQRERNTSRRIRGVCRIVEFSVGQQWRGDSVRQKSSELQHLESLWVSA